MKTKTENNPHQSLIDRSNIFYLEMSRKFITQRDYDIMYRLLIEKIPMSILAVEYNISGERVRQIYEKVYSKLKSITKTLQDDVDFYIQRKDNLREQYLNEINHSPKRTNQGKPLDSKDLILNSTFRFGQRMRNMFNFIDVYTLEDLVAIPLYKLTLFRGFKKECKKELIAFIEFEKIEHLFEGFSDWKD